MVKKSRKIYILGSAIIALASLFLVYFLLIVTGVVQVKNEIITITSGSIEATYNGEPHKCESVEVTQGELRKGHTIEAIYTGEVINVGSAANTYSFKIVDSEGVDVTDKYTVEKLEGTITVNKRPISLRASNASKQYDGKPLSTDSKEYSWVSGNLIDGHTIEVSSHGEQTEAGIGENLLDVQIYDADGNVMTQNYDIQVVPGALTVNPIPLVITSGSANKRYDGLSLTSKDWQLEHGRLLDLNEDGEPDHRIEAETNGTITEPGKVDNTFRFIKVIDIATGADVTHNYDIDSQYGVLEIKSVALIFKSRGIYKYYDGKPIETNPNDVELFSGELFEGHYFEVEMVDIPNVNADKYDYEFKVIIRDQNGEDITSNYDVEYEVGKAEIKGADLSIRTGTSSKEYDGEELFNDKYEILDGELLNGDTIEVLDYTKIVDVIYDKKGSVQLVDNVIDFKIVDVNGNDVTKNYNIADNLYYGTLMITQKNVKIITPSDSKEYDGTNLKYTLPDGKTFSDVVTVSSDTPLVDGHTLSDIALDTELSPADINYKNTYVLNVPTFKIIDEKGNDVTGNYLVSNDKYGKLSYSRKNITINSEGDFKEYDGTPLSCYEYKVIYESVTYDFNDEFINEKFLKDHIIEIENGTEITNVQLVNNNIDSVYNIFEIKIYNMMLVNGVEKKIDVTDLFSITKQYGKLTINPKQINVKSDSKNYIYTGKEQEAPTGYTLLDDTLDLTALGINIKYVSSDVIIKDATTKKNSAVYEVIDLATNKKNPNYAVNVVEKGNLVVNPYPITLKTVDEHFEYEADKVFTSLKKTLKVTEDILSYTSQIDATKGQTTCVLLGTGEILKIGDVWSTISVSLGEVDNCPREIDIVDQQGNRTLNNYSINKAYGKLIVTNPNYDYTIAPAEVAVPYTLTLGQPVDMYYALNNGFIEAKNAIIGIDKDKFGTVQSATYKLDDANPSYTRIDAITSKGYSFICLIRGSAVSTTEDKLEIVLFKLYAPGDFEQKTDIRGTEGFRIEVIPNDIIVFEYTLTIETTTASKVYDGTPLSGEDFEVTITGLASGHQVKYVDGSFANVTNVGKKINRVRVKVVDDAGKDVTKQYYQIENFGTLSVTEREASLFFDDPFIIKEDIEGNTAGVTVTNQDFDPTTYQVFDLVDGHSLESFSTDAVTETGLYEITKYTIVDENGEDVTKNYSLFADYIFIQIEYISLS